ncbi:MAG: hypothetical protein HY852_25605 [Bradyrhizobium sp.]|uniref:hypothetical protein n=1 Tax=Bradyrhizobium sp. TaxID=376 RepID=UPI0025BECA22|nr:hypothetical protein [Bradyrhizobium sp.]MBI5265185.1 hypothetical protein [Bradyrhizobium sp.]
MKKTLFAAAVIAALLPTSALAQERAGDAALGAVSGAIVLGPVGAVAGALIGYTAGPSIARSWGLRQSRPAKTRPYSAANGRPPASPAAPTAAPTAANGGGRVANSQVSVAPPAPAIPLAPARSTAPPVQGFD